MKVIPGKDYFAILQKKLIEILNCMDFISQ